ncbi:uncharacterized protein LOC143563927 [Bidens hawaiensis]|uniref:uncharacterized protein LOC143563927 n=1 Tax=Bidens hawaiensis TaxID=980011 RepID=UPI0040492752
MAITPFLLECKFNSTQQPSYLSPLRSLLGLLFLYDHHHFAASGGMMGESAFPSSHSYNMFVSPSYHSSSRATSCRAPVKAPNEAKPIVVITNLVVFKVGSLNTGRSLQQDINRIAEVADTSTSKGWNFVLQESILSLLWHSNYSISGYSLVDAMSSVVECEERFNQLTNEESAKFDEVTAGNVNITTSETEVQQVIVIVGSLTSILW